MPTPVKPFLFVCMLLGLAVLGPAAAPASAQSSPAPQLPPATAGANEAIYIPQRVFDTQRKRFTDFEMMSADLARADVVLVGEQHDDANTHRLERAILEGFARRHVPVTLSLEMFERDVQESVDTYVGGTAAEADFLKGTRPWPRYSTDYRPLVEFAKAHKWPVVAANVPRRIASEIAKGGRSAVDALSVTDRRLAATDLQCPHDEYYNRFAETMGTHPAAGSGAGSVASAADTATERYYWAQCVKDETMAESIANALGAQGTQPNAQGGPLVVHFNGAFHSDYRLGTASRVIRRAPKSNVKVISVVPVDNLDSINVDEYRKRGDFIVFTLKPPASQ